MTNQSRGFDRDEPRPPAPGPTELYPAERHWCSFNDYHAIMNTTRELGAKRVLEFGPGSSTLALIEGGATHIDTLEDDPHWAGVYESRLVPNFPTPKFPATVRVHRYTWSDPPSIPAVDGERYDLAMIDGPLGSDRRGAAVRYALERAKAVLAPTEDRNPKVRQELTEIAESQGLKLHIWETGPLSGGYALLTKPITPAAPAEHAEQAAPAPLPEESVRNITDLETPTVPELVTPSPPALDVQVVPALTKRQQKRRDKKAREQT